MEYSDLISEAGEIERLGMLNKRKIENLEIIESDIPNNKVAKLLGRKKGAYCLVNFIAEHYNKDCLTKIIKEKIEEYIDKECESAEKFLILGLGNCEISADSLGNQIIKQVKNGAINGRKVITLATGIYGKTGISSFDFAKAIIKQIKPDIIIVIDALATRDYNKLAGSIQLTTAGITPGGGVNNSQKIFDEKNFNCPTIAIGAPLVMYAVSLIKAEINRNIAKENYKGNFDIEENLKSLIITRADIEEKIKDLGEIIASAINSVFLAK